MISARHRRKFEQLYSSRVYFELNEFTVIERSICIVIFKILKKKKNLQIFFLEKCLDVDRAYATLNSYWR